MHYINFCYFSPNIKVKIEFDVENGKLLFSGTPDAIEKAKRSVQDLVQTLCIGQSMEIKIAGNYSLIFRVKFFYAPWIWRDEP